VDIYIWNCVEDWPINKKRQGLKIWELESETQMILWLHKRVVGLSRCGITVVACVELQELCRIEFLSAEQKYESQSPTNCYCIFPQPLMFHTENVTDLDILSCTLLNWCLRNSLLYCSYLMLVLYTSYKIIMIFHYFKGEVCKWMKTWTWHSEDCASWYILITKPTRCMNFSKFILGISRIRMEHPNPTSKQSA